MPSAFTHAAVGLVLADLVRGPAKPPSFWILSAVLAAAPDLDTAGLYLGVPYGSVLGHRGFFHSLCFSVLAGVAVGLLTPRLYAAPVQLLAVYFSVVLASHGILDGFTNGGLGIAYLSPLDNRRYFFPWQPIQVAPIGVAAFFSRLGLSVIRSELLWVWLPAAVLVITVRLFRRP